MIRQTLEVASIPSARIEDYLEEVFAVEAQGRSATVTSLAEALSVTKGTVVSALHRLVEEGLLTHERYGSHALTEAGRERALRIFRRHEYMTQLFFGVLGIERRRAEAMACGLEHDMDEDAEGRLMILADFLSRGIREGALWASELEARLSDPLALPCPLSLLDPGERGIVARVTAEGSLKKRLLDMGVLPETPLAYLRASPLGDPLEVDVRGMRLSLRRSEAATVWVRRVAEN